MKMKNLLALALLTPLSTGAYASDHIDGPITTKHRVADLTDLYAFPTPKKPGFLTLILDSYPVVHPAGHYADKVSNTFFLRKAAVKGSGESFFFETSDEASITCTWVTPEATEEHVVNCKGPNGLEASSAYDKVSDWADGAGMRVFSGMRSDPFFFNGIWAKKAAEKGVIGSPSNMDIMAHTNCLTVVLEIDTAKLFKGGASLIAVAAEATTQDAPGAPVRRLDRVGRPEITNVSLVAHGDEKDLRDGYNLDRPFQVPAANQQAYKERLVTNIGFYDKTDGKKNWDDRAKDTFASVLADDFLVTDITKPCGEPSFLEIEKSVLQHKAYQTCGGRKPTDDIMDILFTYYIAGLDGARIRDGVDKPFMDISGSFPYLAEPDLSILGKAQALIKRKLMGL
jgi:hypothetical protein